MKCRVSAGRDEAGDGAGPGTRTRKRAKRCARRRAARAGQRCCCVGVRPHLPCHAASLGCAVLGQAPRSRCGAPPHWLAGLAPTVVQPLSTSTRWQPLPAQPGATAVSMTAAYAQRKEAEAPYATLLAAKHGECTTVPARVGRPVSRSAGLSGRVCSVDGSAVCQTANQAKCDILLCLSLGLWRLPPSLRAVDARRRAARPSGPGAR